MLAHYYTAKSSAYFSHVRMDIISLLPHNPQQIILELGAGTCSTLRHIKQHQLAKEVTGVELRQIPGSNQQHSLIDHFHVADIEKDVLPLPHEYFDIIICADILEHLADPWEMIEKITGYLKPGGKIIVSIPNIREVKTMYSILFKGDFRYDAAGGIMDKTHLRFFCKKNMEDLLTTKNLQPVFSTPNFLLPAVPGGRKRRIINRLSLRLFESLLTVQYIFIAQKN